MKKIVLILAFAIVVASTVLAQETMYVSAKGSDNNSGSSEAEPTTFSMALTGTMLSKTKKIIIIGTLDITHNSFSNNETVFVIDDTLAALAKQDTTLGEIVITGKPNASGTERAILTAKGSGKIAVWVSRYKIRFEHIEISGGEGENGVGLYISNNAQVTLGPGAVVRNNAGIGIFVNTDGSCIIDGGEVYNNNDEGVCVAGAFTLRNGTIKDNSSRNVGGGVAVHGKFTMSGGTITNNRTGTSANYLGGGVCVVKGGQFTMTGGTITNNRAQGAGGGVGVMSGGRFDQNGGTISGNSAGIRDPNVYREP